MRFQPTTATAEKVAPRVRSKKNGKAKEEVGLLKKSALEFENFMLQTTSDIQSRPA
jgi:hypothetical protein